MFRILKINAGKSTSKIRRAANMNITDMKERKVKAIKEIEHRLKESEMQAQDSLVTEGAALAASLVTVGIALHASLVAKKITVDSSTSSE
nr:hypothetical protein [Tanacetum cinerariifolium]